jgi:hypothetical protein
MFGFFMATISLSWGGPLPWIGVSLDWRGFPVTGDSPLPEGVGLEVSEVVDGGPLDQAGGKPGDVWWKLDDQILISKRQMLVLLRSRQPGDKAKVTYYRDGALADLTLTLGVRDESKTDHVFVRPDHHKKARVLAKREKVARVVVNDHKLSLRAEGDRWRFEIEEDETVVLSALVSERDLAEKVPSKWHQSFLVLRLTLGETGCRSPGKKDEKKTRYLPRAPTPVESN